MSIMLKGKPNITVKVYLQLLVEMKSAAWRDLKQLSEIDLKKDDPLHSFWGIQLRYRDDEDCLYADCASMGYQHFVKFYPYLWEYMNDESESLLEDGEDFEEPMESKFYWEIVRYIQIADQIYEQYEMSFSMNCKMLSVRGNSTDFENDSFHRHLLEARKYFTDEQKFIIDNTVQMTSPLNVVLPYKPGDILYIDANPYGKPFYAVYCAETAMGDDYFNWTIDEYGHYKREHPCLYISEDYKGLDFSNLTGYSYFTDYIVFPYAPLDRIKVVKTCDQPDLLKASKMLKENPDIYFQWEKIRRPPRDGGGGLEKIIFNTKQ